jgi:GTP-dependent phosphoenolpyruvate carboxykinase
MTGLHLPKDTLEKLLKIDNKDWLEELKSIKKFFQQFRKDLPVQLWDEYEALSCRLKSE